MKSISDISSCVGWDISFARCNQHIHRADSINQLFAGVLLIKFLFQNSVNNKSSNPIVQMGMFMDADGIPLAFSVFDGNRNEQPSMSPLEQKIIKDFEASDFIVCTDAGLSSTANRKFNSIQGRGFVTTQSIKKLKGFLQDFCLEDDGWYLPGSNKKYKLSELDEETDYEKVFYKDRWINENNLEQHLIVTYSIKYRNYQRTIRERQIERAKKFVESPSKFF